MIEVSKADDYRSCCVCHSRKDVYRIMLRSEVNNSGTEIPICKDCYAKMYLAWDCAVDRW